MQMSQFNVVVLAISICVRHVFYNAVLTDILCRIYSMRANTDA